MQKKLFLTMVVFNKEDIMLKLWELQERYSGLVLDPMGEAYFNWSPYTYVANNPILLIDPNGMEIYSIEGGVRFTEEDAVNAFNIISGRAKNVYVDIEHKVGTRSATNLANKKGVYGSWAVFSVKNFEKANLALGAFEDYSLANLVLETHGKQSHGQSLIATDDEKIPATDNSNKIFTSDINWVNKGNDHSLTNVSQLKALADKVTDGGRFIIASCLVGIGDTGKEFGTALNTLTGNRLNIFLPNGIITTPTGKSNIGNIVNFDDRDFFQVSSKVGWLQSLPTGGFNTLRSISLSRSVSKPVNIAK